MQVLLPPDSNSMYRMKKTLHHMPKHADCACMHGMADSAGKYVRDGPIAFEGQCIVRCCQLIATVRLLTEYYTRRDASTDMYRALRSVLGKTIVMVLLCHSSQCGCFVCFA